MNVCLHANQSKNHFLTVSSTSKVRTTVLFGGFIKRKKNPRRIQFFSEHKEKDQSLECCPNYVGIVLSQGVIHGDGKTSEVDVLLSY